MNIPIWVPEAFRVIAHRGSSAYAPENTLPAFKLAREMGVGEVELDVQLAIDGVVVLCHDLVLTRYGHGDVVVEEMAQQAPDSNSNVATLSSVCSVDPIWFADRNPGTR